LRYTSPLNLSLFERARLTGDHTRSTDNRLQVDRPNRTR
jgi:hypothetical protein